MSVGGTQGAEAQAEPSISFAIADCITLSLVAPDDRTVAYTRSQMDPYRPTAPAPASPDVILEVVGAPERREFCDIQNPAGDGLVTAADGTGFYVVQDGLACRLPDTLLDGPARLTLERGFPVWRIFGPVIRPALQLRGLAREAAVVHGASVAVGDAGVVVAGWSESGKTETALALIERGATFLSDKWTVMRPDSTIATFPISVGIRRWVLRYLPHLRSSLPRSARAQFAVAALAAGAARPARLLRSDGRLAGLTRSVLQRATEIADRAALSPSQVRRAYGQEGRAPWSAKLRVVAHLTTVSGRVDARPADAAWAARRLARSAAFERRAAFELYERRRFAIPDSDGPSLEDVVRAEAEVLERVFADALVLEVRAPFPTDPRPVAEAISRFL
jgi:hypothetical protein